MDRAPMDRASMDRAPMDRASMDRDFQKMCELGPLQTNEEGPDRDQCAWYALVNAAVCEGVPKGLNRVPRLKQKVRTTAMVGTRPEDLPCAGRLQGAAAIREYLDGGGTTFVLLYALELKNGVYFHYAAVHLFADKTVAVMNALTDGAFVHQRLPFEVFATTLLNERKDDLGNPLPIGFVLS